MDLALRGKAALVTGGSRGIGFAIASRLLEEGCSVTIVGRDRAALDVAVERLRPLGAVTGHAADLATTAGVASCFPLLAPLDLLVNSAGAVPRGTLTDVSAERFREAFDGKVMATIDLCREAVPAMAARGGGVIVNVIGISGERPNPKSVATSTANAALIAFTQAVGATSVDRNVRVVGVNPGLIATERTAPIRDASNPVDAAAYDHLMRSLPFGRMGEPREVADLVAFLASPRAGYVSGALFSIDAGARFRA